LGQISKTLTDSPGNLCPHVRAPALCATPRASVITCSTDIVCDNNSNGSESSASKPAVAAAFVDEHGIQLSAFHCSVDAPLSLPSRATNAIGVFLLATAAGAAAPSSA
jgi:cell division septation protein DedD